MAVQKGTIDQQGAQKLHDEGVADGTIVPSKGLQGEDSTGIGVYGGTLTGIGVKGQSGHGGLAGKFVGNVEVTGDVILSGADCAEEFDVADDKALIPGSVVVIDDLGDLCLCSSAYDSKVAGVLSGAGSFRPALVLDRQSAAERPRKAIALVGKVFCYVDASYAPIALGDLLTTSATPGHAMKASDPTKAWGAVIGKALRRLESGRSLIPILVTLQ